MTTIYELGNDVELDLNNISAAESDEDDRENEIKQLLAGALNNETFYDDDDGSEASFAQSSLCERDNQEKRPNDISLHSFHSNPNLANISTNGFSFLNGYSDNRRSSKGEPGLDELLDFRKNLMESRPSESQTDRETGEMEAQNATVSIIHKNHCPQEHMNGGGEVESQVWLGTSSTSKVDQLKTLCDFRERQIVRCEEANSTLSKEKRALNHQVALMKTEMIQMKGTQDEFGKALKLRNEEIVYLKSKIQEAITEYEKLKRDETGLKDENNRLRSEISRLEQEVKLTSTIGSSLQQAEVSEVVRQIREKHAREIASWKNIVVELEGQIRIYKRSEHILKPSYFKGIDVFTQTTTGFNVFTRETQSNSIIEDDNIYFKTLRKKSVKNQSTQVNQNLQEVSPEDEIVDFYENEKKKLISFYEREIQEYKDRLTTLPSKLYSEWKQNEIEFNSNPKPVVINIATMTENESTETISERCSVSVSCDISADELDSRKAISVAQTQTLRETKDIATQITAIMTAERNSLKLSNVSKFVQTDETLKTYEVLAGLIEQWAQEVSDSVRRAEQAEIQARFTEDSLKKLRKRFRDVSKIVAICRKEWKAQEQLLKKKHLETRNHFINILLNLGEKLESLDDVGSDS